MQKSSERHEGWSGTILNITSISGVVPVAQHDYAYNASKHAAINLTRMLAMQAAARGQKVRINSLAPGVYPSEMTAGESDEYQKRLTPPKEEDADEDPGRDIDIAQGVLFAVTNQYLNGQGLAVDGRYTPAAGL